MIKKNGHGPWREAYRPDTFDSFFPTTNVTELKNHIQDESNRSHTYIFHGETGTGKTTAAYIVGKYINCLNPKDGNPCNECSNCKKADVFIEDCNMGDRTGIDETRNMIANTAVMPLSGQKQVIVLDEAHALTKAAQKAWLKVLEDPKPWLYIIFCTTEPDKFIPDLKNRCYMLKFNRLNATQSVKLMQDISAIENISVSKDQLEDIFNKVGGRPRELINALQKFSTGSNIDVDEEIRDRDNIKALVDEILSGNVSTQVWEKVWQQYMNALSASNDNAEGVRRLLLWWLWVYAENKHNYKRKFSLTRIMEVTEVLAQSQLTGEEAKQQLATMIFRAWRNDNSGNNIQK